MPAGGAPRGARCAQQKLLTHRGQRVVVLCSGDPFWYGAGSVLADAVPAEETSVIPAPSTFAWAAARLRWRLEETITLGLHARPIELLRPHLRTGARLIVLARDGAAPAQIANYLDGVGFGLVGKMRAALGIGHRFAHLLLFRIEQP